MHTDLNLLTGLPEATKRGLQMLVSKTMERGLEVVKNQEWVDVIVPEGYLIINTGEELEKKTAGMFKATPHQVINPAGESGERLSAVFFGSWSEEFSLEPFESCVNVMTKGMTEQEKQKYLLDYPKVTVKDNLDSRLIEMWANKSPSEERVKDLLAKGLLRQPYPDLITMYPHLFGK